LYCLGAGVQASLHCLGAGVQASLHCLGAGVQASCAAWVLGCRGPLHCLEDHRVQAYSATAWVLGCKGSLYCLVLRPFASALHCWVLGCRPPTNHCTWASCTTGCWVEPPGACLGAGVQTLLYCLSAGCRPPMCHLGAEIAGLLYCLECWGAGLLYCLGLPVLPGLRALPLAGRSGFYVLTGITDITTSVQEEAFACLEAVGAQWEREKVKDLEDTLYYNQEAVSLPPGEFFDGPLGYLIPPMKDRPRHGARLVVQNNMRVLFYPLTQELTSWTLENREKAVRLLRVCMVYAETETTQYLYRVIPIFARVARDPVITAELQECCKLIGRFNAPKTYFELLMPLLEADESDALARSNAVLVLRAIVEGTSAGLLADQVPEILGAVSRPDMMRTQHTELRLELARLVRALVTHCREACEEQTRDLVAILMHLTATPSHLPQVPELLSIIGSVMRDLADSAGLAPSELVSVFRDTLLSSLQSTISAGTWGSYDSELLLLVSSLECPLPPGEVHQLVKLVTQVLGEVMSGTGARVAVALQCLTHLSSLEAIREHGAIGLSADDAEALLPALIEHLQVRAPDAPQRAPVTEGLPELPEQPAFPAFAALQILVEHSLLPAPLLQQGEWAGAVAACMRPEQSVQLRHQACHLAQRILVSYGESGFPSEDGQDLMLAEAITNCVEDVEDEIRVTALAVLADIVRVVKRPELQLAVSVACTRSHLSLDQTASFEVALQAVQEALREYCPEMVERAKGLAAAEAAVKLAAAEQALVVQGAQDAGSEGRVMQRALGQEQSTEACSQQEERVRIRIEMDEDESESEDDFDAHADCSMGVSEGSLRTPHEIVDESVRAHSSVPGATQYTPAPHRVQIVIEDEDEEDEEEVGGCGPLEETNKMVAPTSAHPHCRTPIEIEDDSDETPGEEMRIPRNTAETHSRRVPIEVEDESDEDEGGAEGVFDELD
ncbi:HEAT repeat-containing protein 2, partial [Cymbomonas tetramitiformis]